MNAQSPASDRVALDTPWLDALQAHPVFDAAHPLFASVASSSTPGAASSRTSTNLLNPRTLCVRHNDVIVAIDREIRIANLLDVKRSNATASALGTPQKSGRAQPAPVLPTYLTLDTPQLDFPIVGITVNPSGRLLAVYGTHRVAVVLLPRSTLGGKTAAGRTSVQMIAVGQYHHSEHSGPGALISKVAWHPLGRGGTSLLVATRDGTLREYDVGGNADEPAQVVNLLPVHLQRELTAHFGHPPQIKSKSAGSRSSASTPITSRTRNDMSHYSGSVSSSDVELASFTLGWDRHPQSLASLDRRAQRGHGTLAPGSLAQDDWGPFTIYALLRNGDVYALCPFLPTKMTMTAASVEKFAAYVSASCAAQQLEGDVPEAGIDLKVIDAQLVQAKIAARFSSLLKKQASKTIEAAQRELVKGKNQNGKRFEPDMSRGSTPGAGFKVASRISEAAALEVDLNELHVDIANPWVHEPDAFASTRAQHPRAVPQGPFLLTPAPRELSDERESQASDICLTRIVLPTADSNGSTSQAQGSAGYVGESDKDELSVLSIVGDDGRVDVCVVLDPVGPRWDSGGETALNRQKALLDSKARSRPGRFALSDSEDDDRNATSGTVQSRRRIGGSGTPAHGRRFVDSVEPEADILPLPSLLVYETIDLGLDLEALAEADLQSGRAAPSFALDPMFRDKLFVVHAEGAHCLSFGSWAWNLLRVVNGREDGTPTGDLPTTSLFDNAADAGRIADDLKYFLADKVRTQIAHLVKTIALTAEKADGESYTIEDAALAEDASGSMPVIGFDLLLDAYLGYAALAVTADGRCVALELTLAAAQTTADPPGRRTVGSQAGARGRSDQFGPDSPAGLRKSSGTARRGEDDDEALYVSLLRSEGSFVPPEPLNVPAGMPVQPRLIVSAATARGGGLAAGPGAALMREAYASLGGGQGGPASSASASNMPLQNITPGTLRFLTKALQAFRAEVREVVRAGNKSQARLDLQFRELKRLLEGLSAARTRQEKFPSASPDDAAGPAGAAKGAAAAARASAPGGIAARLDLVGARQRTLMDRLDRLLQRLIESHSGAEASEPEKAWFAELRTMADQVGVDPDEAVGTQSGSGASGSVPLRGLKADLDKLQHQLKLLRPALAERAVQQQQVQSARKPGSDARGGKAAASPVYGRAQLRALEDALGAEAELVVRAKEKITELTRDLGKASPTPA